MAGAAAAGEGELVFYSHTDVPPSTDTVHRGAKARREIQAERAAVSHQPPGAYVLGPGPGSYHDPIGDEYGSIDGLPFNVAIAADMVLLSERRQTPCARRDASASSGQTRGLILQHVSATQRNENMFTYRASVAYAPPSVGCVREVVATRPPDNTPVGAYLFTRTGDTINLAKPPAPAAPPQARSDQSVLPHMPMSPGRYRDLDVEETGLPFSMENHPTEIKYVVPIGVQRARIQAWLARNKGTVFRVSENTLLRTIVETAPRSAHAGQPAYVVFNAVQFALVGFSAIAPNVRGLVVTEKASINAAMHSGSAFDNMDDTACILLANVIVAILNHQAYVQKTAAFKQNKQVADMRLELKGCRKRLMMYLHQKQPHMGW